jgi:carbamoyl-phosphate synthase small subunit
MSFLVLEDGTVFRGHSVGARGIAFGEAVFTTAMSGYQEVVTDPSYAEQIVCFTAPMVGNYGVAPARSESDGPHARAVVMRRAGGEAWTRWLAARGIVALEEVDTRSLVLHIRERGAMRAAAVAGEASVEHVLARVRAEPPMAGRSLVAGVSTREAYSLGRGPTRIVVLDYGCKRSIVERVLAAGTTVRVLPHSTAARAVLGEAPDGVVLSNGPGDPAALPGRSRRSASCSAACRSSGSASATSSSRRRPATAPSSSRSDTAAQTIPCSSSRPAACSSRRRTTGSPSRATDRR